jgi:putative spermidine/putrescine transport system permease protein
VKHENKVDRVDLVLRLFFVGILLFIVAPLLICVVNSFNPTEASRFPPTGISFRWYKNVLFDVGPMSPAQQFRSGFLLSMAVSLGAVSLALLVGSPAAVGLVRSEFPGKEVIRSLFTAPLVVPQVVLGVALFLLFIRVGLFGSPLSLVLSYGVIGLPFVVTLISATLLGVDPATEEAALDLGASPFQAFLRITLPQMRTGLMISALFVFISSFNDVQVAVFLARPGIITLPVRMFNYSMDHQNPSLAAFSTLLIAFVAVFVVVAVLVLRTSEYRKYLMRE